MKTTFAYPIKPKRTDFSIKGIFQADGPKEVGDAYRGRFGGPPFPIARDEQRKPLVLCTANKDCNAVYDPDKGHWRGDCKGTCGDC